MFPRGSPCARVTPQDDPFLGDVGRRVERLEVGPVTPQGVEARTHLDPLRRGEPSMAKTTGAGSSGKKPRHSPAQKKAARQAANKASRTA